MEEKVDIEEFKSNSLAVIPARTFCYNINNSTITKINRGKRHSNFFKYDSKHYPQNFDKGLIQNEWNRIGETIEGISKNLRDNYHENSKLKQKKYPLKTSKLDKTFDDEIFDTRIRKDFNSNKTYTQEVKENNYNFVGENEKNVLLFPSAYHTESYRSINTNEIGTKEHLKKDTIHENMLTPDNVTNEEHELALYAIGDPDLWYTAHVQMFEKLTSPEGNVLWNDLTKHATASVSSKRPEWSNQDMNIQYKPIEWLGRDDFLLPLQNLCLVVPLLSGNSNVHEATFGDFIIVPTDDIITLSDQKVINKRNENSIDSNTASPQDSRLLHRRVAVRMTRALVGDDFHNHKIIARGSERFLKLPHTKPHKAQIDFEVKADDNALIIIGMHGRLTTAVSDSTRQIRSVFSIQATNMGLAGARFRVLIRECTPKLIDASINGRESEGTISDSVLFPPRHTRSFRLEFPLTIPVDIAHCTVALVNENEESVAVRDVRIKKGDRCFCVWHCDCICLGEDPKLLCRRLSEAQLVAAGLPMEEKSRCIRSVYYPDVVTLNLFVTVAGVLLALVFLGIIKASLGLILRCVGSWGLQLLIQAPRKLDQYYESSLKSRTVVYDKEGWPVHPDTKQRSVRLISKPMEFILNLIFFITLPCVLICDAIKKMLLRCNCPEQKLNRKHRKSETKKCFSSHDVQNIPPPDRQRRGDLHRWMSPQAEELSTGIWHEGLVPQEKMLSDYLQPLLRERKCCNKITDKSICLDSEQDDTEYILMQIQKSKESMAKSERILQSSATGKNTTPKTRNNKT